MWFDVLGQSAKRDISEKGFVTFDYASRTYDDEIRGYLQQQSRLN
jgi:hypothetical protein